MTRRENMRKSYNLASLLKICTSLAVFVLSEEREERRKRHRGRTKVVWTVEGEGGWVWSWSELAADVAGHTDQGLLFKFSFARFAGVKREAGNCFPLKSHSLSLDTLSPSASSHQTTQFWALKTLFLSSFAIHSYINVNSVLHDEIKTVHTTKKLDDNDPSLTYQRFVRQTSFSGHIHCHFREWSLCLPHVLLVQSLIFITSGDNL